MESKTKLMGHAVHPVLVALPLGLFVTAVAFDTVALVTRNRRLAQSAFDMTGVGVATGLAAAVFGTIDWLAIPEKTRAKGVGELHGLGNGAVMLLFGASWLMRRERPWRFNRSAYMLSVIGAGLAGVTGWLGGELVQRLGVGIEPGANLNAPSSLLGRPAIEEIAVGDTDGDIDYVISVYEGTSE